jgi:hypothetical protein
MDESLRAQIDSNLSHLDALIRRGRKLRETLAENPTNKSSLVANRAWQQDIGVAINQLSGGSKAHWLARAFSEAFLLRTNDGQVIEAVEPAEIVERLVGVLDQAVLSLSRMGEEQRAGASAPAAAPPLRRFEFVHNVELRPVLEQAYLDSRDALEHGDYGAALLQTSGILEAIVTDALQNKGVGALADVAMPAGAIADWSFNDRLAVAESAGIIRGGCARLPESARRYRESGGAEGNPPGNISERDARRTMQVLHVVMKDLDPGR